MSRIAPAAPRSLGTILKPSGEKGRSEEADDYRAVVARLNDSWRVIVCAGGIQWILQRHRGERRGTARWEGRCYCRTSQALNRLSRKHAGAVDPAAAAILAALPARIEDPAPKPAPAVS